MNRKILGLHRSTKKATFTRCNHVTYLEENDSRCTCNYCGKEYCCDTTSRGTSSLSKYLKNLCKKYPYKKVEIGQYGSNFETTIFSQQACKKACAKRIIVVSSHSNL